METLIELPEGWTRTDCRAIAITSTDPLIYKLDVQFGSDYHEWQQTSNAIAQYLIANPYVNTMSDGAKAFIREMHAQYQRNTTLNDQLQEARRTNIYAHEGFAKVSERLNDEAEERGWCDTFDAIIDEVNDSLEGPFSLALRMKDYVIDAVLAVSSHVSVSTTVSARNEREARELVSDDFNSYFDTSDISQALSDSEVDDWSIEEIDATEA